MMDAKMTGCKELTSLIQESKYFAKLPIKRNIQEVRLTKDQQKLDWNNPNRLDVVAILGAGHVVKATIKACKILLNRKEK